MNGINIVPGLRENLEKALATQLEEINALLRQTERASEAFSKLTPADTVTFEVTLNSLWANEGETDVTAKSTVGLKQAIHRAQDRFKQINNRSDVQARYQVQLHFGPKNEFTLTVPEQFYREFR